MRLKESRERCKSLMAHKPEAQVANDDIDRALNDALAVVWGFRPWTWTERLTDLPLYPDVDRASSGVSVTLALDSRSVAFSTDLPELYSDATREETRWVGQTFYQGGRNYRILSVGTDRQSLVLEEPIRFETSSLTGSPTDWELRQTELVLPEDCAEVLALVHDDDPHTSNQLGKVEGLYPRRAEAAGLRHEATGIPDSYIPLPDLEIPAAGVATATASTGVTPADASHGIPGGRFVELTWALCRGGRIGALAEPAIVQLADDSKFYSITVNFLANDGTTSAATDAPDYSKRRHPLAWEGYQKRLFFNSNLDPTTGIRAGLPRWREVNQRALSAIENERDSYPLVAEDDEASATLLQPHQINPGNPTLQRPPDGIYQRLRLYPRPDSSLLDYPEVTISGGGTSAEHTAPKTYYRLLRCRYRTKPPQLAEAADTPPMPMELHLDVVHLAVATLLLPHDPQGAARYEARALGHLGKMVSKYVARTDVTLVRGSSWPDNPGGRQRLFGNAFFTRTS